MASVSLQWPHCTVIDVYSPQIVEKCVAGLPKKESLLGAMRSIRSKDSEKVQCLNLEAFRGAVFRGYSCHPSHVAVGWNEKHTNPCSQASFATSSGCMASDMSLGLSEPQFALLQNKGKS